MNECVGKVALITGASRGIGAMCGRVFAKAGMSVVFAARSMSEMGQVAADIERGGGTAKICVCDVAQYGQVESSVETALTSFGRLDIVFNNACMIYPSVRLG